MNPSPANNFPWELISSSFTGGLTQEEEFSLRQWLESDPGNKEKYQQLQELWNNGTDDYKLYLAANETKAWDALYAELSFIEEARVINLNTGKARRLFYQIAAASAILLLIGFGYWFFSMQSNIITYETAANEQKSVQLTDGTSIALNPDTKIKVSQGYNKKNRTVIMTSGEAAFTIEHQKDLPFIVDMGDVYVQDIGTVFNIKKEINSIKVSVLSGTVIFNKISTEESRVLNAGMSLAFDTKNERFGELLVDSPAVKVNATLLNFDNAPLTDVIALVQKKFGKTIRFENESMAHKRTLTAKLEGVSYNKVLDVICITHNLDYTLKDSIYILREKKGK